MTRSSLVSCVDNQAFWIDMVTVSSPKRRSIDARIGSVRKLRRFRRMLYVCIETRVVVALPCG